MVVLKLIHLNIMRMVDGKPQGVPIWKTPLDPEKHPNLSDDTITTTLVSLSKRFVRPSLEGKNYNFVKLSFNNIIFDIYLPSSGKDQFALITIFQSEPPIKTTEKERDELILTLVSKIKKIEEFRKVFTKSFGDQSLEIEFNSTLYKKILSVVFDEVEKFNNIKLHKLKEEIEKKRRIQEEKIEKFMSDTENTEDNE